MMYAVSISDLTMHQSLLLFFRKFINRSDIAIILISQSIADVVRYIIDAHTAPIPTILEIPSKDAPYDPSKVTYCLMRDARPFYVTRGHLQNQLYF